MVVTAMSMKQVHERAGQQDQVGQITKHVPPVLTKDVEHQDQGQRCANQQERAVGRHIFMFLNLRELAITLTEDSAIAAAAMIGESNRPKTG